MSNLDSNLTKLNAYLNTNQYQALREGLQGEESQAFIEMINKSLSIINKTPDVYSQDDIDLPEKIVYLHYFACGWDWFITEIDRERLEFFGYVISPFCSEWGYTSIRELTSIKINNLFGVELDLHFDPISFKEIKE